MGVKPKSLSISRAGFSLGYFKAVNWPCCCPPHSFGHSSGDSDERCVSLLLALSQTAAGSLHPQARTWTPTLPLTVWSLNVVKSLNKDIFQFATPGPQNREAPTGMPQVPSGEIFRSVHVFPHCRIQCNNAAGSAQMWVSFKRARSRQSLQRQMSSVKGLKPQIQSVFCHLLSETILCD